MGFFLPVAHVQFITPFFPLAPLTQGYPIPAFRLLHICCRSDRPCVRRALWHYKHFQLALSTLAVFRLKLLAELHTQARAPISPA